MRKHKMYLQRRYIPSQMIQIVQDARGRDKIHISKEKERFETFNANVIHINYQDCV